MPTASLRDPSRRTLLGGGLALLVVGAIPRGAAARAQLSIEVPDAATGAIVAAVAGTAVTIAKTGGEPGVIVVDGTEYAALGKIMLKGSGAARRRFLDDARNAPSFGASVRDVLKKVDPSGAAGYDERHKAWSRPFARQVIKWTSRLAQSPVAGKRVADPYGRIYLLQWAGATIDPKATTKPPAALAKAPDGPTKAAIAAYTSYIDALIGAIA